MHAFYTHFTEVNKEMDTTQDWYTSCSENYTFTAKNSNLLQTTTNTLATERCC